MHLRKRWKIGLLIIACLQMAACTQAATSVGSEGDGPPPATVEQIAGTDQNRVILTADAAARIGLETGRVEQEQIGGNLRTIVSYSAVIYDLNGGSWVYTNPSSLTYVRTAVSIEEIENDRTVLLSGPPSGTMVVTVGAPELYGAELGVGECGACAP